MVCFHQVLHDVQSDARARLVVLRLVEGREDFLLLVGSDSIAIIRHHDAEMLIVSHVAAQAHVVLRVFVGIRHQVADYFGYRFLVDDGSEIVLRIIHLQLGAVLPQGWLKSLHHGSYQLRDVLKLEVHLHAALLHLVEVEQLVHQVQQSLRISINHIYGFVHHLSFPGRNSQLRPFALQVLQRTDDERNRGSDFVGYHGEELQSGIAHLLLLLLLQRIKFVLMATLLTLQSALGIEIDGVAQQQQIEQLGWQGPPERRMHLYLQLRLLLAPYTVVVGCLYTEGVAAIRQIGVGGTMLMRGGPFLVETFEHVGILVLFGRHIAQRRKRDIDDIIIIREVQLVDVSKRLRQLVGTYLHMLVEEFERSDRHRRSHMIDLYLIRKESIEALGSSEIHATIRSQQPAVGQKLVTGQSVVTVEHQGWLARHISHDSLGRREPHLALTLHDAGEIMAWSIHLNKGKLASIHQEFTDSLVGGNIESSLVAAAQTVHLVAEQRTGIVLLMQVLAPCLAAVEAPETCTLSSKPYIAPIVFIDIDGKSFQRPYLLKAILLFIKEIDSLHRSSPESVLAITVDAVAAAARSPIVELINLHIARPHIHAQKSGAIGTHPQRSTLGKQGVNIVFAHLRLAGIIHKPVGSWVKAVEARIIGGYPDTATGIFHKPAHYISSHAAFLTGIIGLESAHESRRRNIVYAAIIGSYPQTALTVGGDAIYKAIVGTPGISLEFRHHAPVSLLEIVFHQSVVAAHQYLLVGVVVELVNMVHGIAERRDDLFGGAIGIHLIESVLPGTHQDASVGIGEHRHTTELHAGIFQSERVKLVGRFIQTQQKLMVSVGLLAECPHLIVHIYQRAVYKPLIPLHRIIPAFVGGEVVSEHALTVGRNPHVAVSIQREMNYMR